MLEDVSDDHDYVYYWKYIDEHGMVCGRCDDPYIDRDQCLLDAEDNAPDITGNTMVSLKLCKVKLRRLNSRQLVFKVYSYLLYMEFKARVKEYCPGCQVNSPSQVDHMSGGCLDERRQLVARHYRICHVKISVPRLKLAVAALHIYYAEIEVPYMDYKHILKFTESADGRRL